MKLLPKYLVRGAVSPRKLPLTFEPNGFFSTFKKRALEALKDVDFHRSSPKTNLFADFFVTTTILLSLAVAYTQSYLIIMLAGWSNILITSLVFNYYYMINIICTIFSFFFLFWMQNAIIEIHTYDFRNFSRVDHGYCS